MDFLIADANKKDLCFLEDGTSLDFDIGSEDDFQVSVPLTDYDETVHTSGNILYCIGTEYGGVLDDPEISTKDNKITFTGDTFRGMMKKKYIEPPEGEDYRIINGEANECIKSLIQTAFTSTIFSVSSLDTGAEIKNFQFDRYCSLLDGLTKMLASVNQRLIIKAIRTKDDFTIELSSKPIVDYSQDIEFSQDNNINFKIKKVTNKYNYMIALGKGELHKRQVLYFRCDAGGAVTQVSAIPKGDNVKVYLYDNTSTEDFAADAVKKFAEINAADKYSMTMKDGIELEIGDVVGGRDYVTGLTIAQPITRKIIKYNNKKQSISYEIGGGSNV